MAETNGARESKGFWGEVVDAVTPKTFLLVVGVLFVQLAFITSYVGAFHNPKPTRMPLAVVAPAPVSAGLIGKLNALPGEPLKASAAADRADAQNKIMNRTVTGALVVDPASTADTLLVAGGGGSAGPDALKLVLTAIEAAGQRTLTVEDIDPLAKGDSRGLSSFYLAVGLCVGGYLVASILGVAVGSKPANLKRAVIRLLAIALYAIVAGLGAALIMGPILGALPGSLVGLWAMGALTIFAVGATTMALTGILGVVGIGVAILLIVVLGNPSAGGVYPASLMPRFWAAIGQSFPPGASTTIARGIAYFHGKSISGAVTVLIVWAVVGVAVALLTAGKVRTPWRKYAEDEAVVDAAG